MDTLKSEVIFRPQYGWRVWSVFPVFALAIPICIAKVWSDPLANPMLSLSVAAFMLALPYMCLLLIRRIRFNEEFFVIEYYFRRPKTIAYCDIQDVSGFAVKMKSGRIGLGMVNSNELIEIFGRKIVEGQLSGEMASSHLRQGKAILVIAISYPISYVALASSGISKQWVQLMAFAISFTIGFIVSYALKLRDENNAS